MSGKALKKFETAIRWLTLTVIVLFLVEELIRVTGYVIGEWGIQSALTDGAVLYKTGEAAILIPFFLLVHLSGVRTPERLAGNIPTGVDRPPDVAEPTAQLLRAPVLLPRRRQKVRSHCPAARVSTPAPVRKRKMISTVA